MIFGRSDDIFFTCLWLFFRTITELVEDTRSNDLRLMYERESGWVPWCRLVALVGGRAARDGGKNNGARTSLESGSSIGRSSLVAYITRYTISSSIGELFGRFSRYPKVFLSSRYSRTDARLFHLPRRVQHNRARHYSESIVIGRPFTSVIVSNAEPQSSARRSSSLSLRMNKSFSFIFIILFYFFLF